MKRAGAEIVSRDAVEGLLFYLEERSKKITGAALKFAKHAKRKKITQNDVQLAIDYL
jgi:DNA-binding protein